MVEVKTSVYKTLIVQLLGWLHQLPVIGFNSGKYDLSVFNNYSYLTCRNHPNKTTATTAKTKIMTNMIMMMRPDSSLKDRTHACVSRRRN